MRHISLILFSVCIYYYSYAQQSSSPWKSLFNAAERYYQSKNYSAAIIEYGHCVALSDTSFLVRNRMGACYWNSSRGNDVDKINSAIENFERSLAITKNPEAGEYLIRIHEFRYKRLERSVLAIEDALKRGDDVALIRLRERFGISTEVSGVTMLSDYEKDLTKKLESLVDALKVAISIEKSEAVIKKYYYKMVSYIVNVSKDYDKAYNTAQEALKLQPSNIDMLYYSAKTSNELKNYDKAISSAKKAINIIKTKQNTNDLDKFYYELGSAYFHKENYKESNRVLALIRDNAFRERTKRFKPDFYYSLAIAYFDIYNFEDAKVYLSEALKIDSSFALANIKLAEIATRSENHAQAILHYDLAIKNNRLSGIDLMELYHSYISVLLDAGKNDRAKEICDRAEARDMISRQIVYMKSISLFKMGRYEEAASTIQKLVLLTNISSVDIARYNFVYGLILEKMKDFATARGAYSNARRVLLYSFAAQARIESLPGM